MISDGKPLYSRRFLCIYIRFLNRTSQKLKRFAEKLSGEAHRLTVSAVVEYHKANGTWPQSDHIYPEMRG